MAEAHIHSFEDLQSNVFRSVVMRTGLALLLQSSLRSYERACRIAQLLRAYKAVITGHAFNSNAGFSTADH